MEKLLPLLILCLGLVLLGALIWRLLRRSPQITPEAQPGDTEFWVERYRGLERYRIGQASWNLYRDAESGRSNLWLRVNSQEVIRQFPDSRYVRITPAWEVNLIRDEVDLANLNAVLPAGCDDKEGWVALFFGHGGGAESANNCIRVINRDGDHLRIRLSAETIDPIYYDGSKPKSKLLVETWFTLDPEGRRSMC